MKNDRAFVCSMISSRHNERYLSENTSPLMHLRNYDSHPHEHTDVDVYQHNDAAISNCVKIYALPFLLAAKGNRSSVLNAEDHAVDPNAVVPPVENSWKAEPIQRCNK